LPAPNGNPGNLDVNDVYLRSTGQWLSQGQGVFVDNLTNTQQANFQTTSTTYVDVPSSIKQVTLPAGTAVMFWSMSYHNPEADNRGSLYYIRPVVGSNAGVGIDATINRSGWARHDSFSGSFTTTTTGGTVTIKLQVKRDLPRPAALRRGYFGDYVSWTIIVFQ
jgi:hypothetical protein